MLSAQNNPWISRTKWLTQALIISVTVNISLIATLIYFALKDKSETLAVELKPGVSYATNAEILHSYSLLPYQELLLRLEDSDPVEDGLTKRDLSLACLAAFHHFNLEKALGDFLFQKRMVALKSADGQEIIPIRVFPGLTDEQFLAILHYARTEQWPFTPQGLFHELKRSLSSKDPSLLNAFYLTSEYDAAYTLLNKTGLQLSHEMVINLILEGDWKILADLSQQQSIAIDFTLERRRLFLLTYLGCNSPIAAKLLLDNDREFVTKRLNDSQILQLLDHYADQTSSLEQCAKELLVAPRSDAIWKRASAILGASSQEISPENFNQNTACEKLLPEPPSILQTRAAFQAPAPPPGKAKKKLHTVQTGDNLWKIARKYHVSVEELMRTNRMDSEKLRPGKQLEIPEKTR